MCSSPWLIQYRQGPTRMCMMLYAYLSPEHESPQTRRKQPSHPAPPLCHKQSTGLLTRSFFAFPFRFALFRGWPAWLSFWKGGWGDEARS